MLEEMSGDTVLAHSKDTVIDELADAENYPVEFLHTVETGGLPPHILHLKVGCVLMVLRNFAPHRGVCNGNRVLLEKIGKRILQVAKLSGPKRGGKIHLPRICCDSTCDGDLPFAFRRYQFPVKLEGNYHQQKPRPVFQIATGSVPAPTRIRSRTTLRRFVPCCQFRQCKDFGRTLSGSTGFSH